MPQHAPNTDPFIVLDDLSLHHLLQHLPSISLIHLLLVSPFARDRTLFWLAHTHGLTTAAQLASWKRPVIISHLRITGRIQTMTRVTDVLYEDYMGIYANTATASTAVAGADEMLVWWNVDGELCCHDMTTPGSVTTRVNAASLLAGPWLEVFQGKNHNTDNTDDDDDDDDYLVPESLHIGHIANQLTAFLFFTPGHMAAVALPTLRLLYTRTSANNSFARSNRGSPSDPPSDHLIDNYRLTGPTLTLTRPPPTPAPQLLPPKCSCGVFCEVPKSCNPLYPPAPVPASPPSGLFLSNTRIMRSTRASFNGVALPLYDVHAALDLLPHRLGDREPPQPPLPLPLQVVHTAVTDDAVVLIISTGTSRIVGCCEQCGPDESSQAAWQAAWALRVEVAAGARAITSMQYYPLVDDARTRLGSGYNGARMAQVRARELLRGWGLGMVWDQNMATVGTWGFEWRGTVEVVVMVGMMGQGQGQGGGGKDERARCEEKMEKMDLEVMGLGKTVMVRGLPDMDAGEGWEDMSDEDRTDFTTFWGVDSERFVVRCNDEVWRCSFVPRGL